jgi:hypothetical protein
MPFPKTESELAAAGIKERPIIFGAPMIRAVMDGRKTQTRRLVKDQGAISDIAGGGIEPVGSRLWVRETWARWTDTGGGWCVVFKADREARQELHYDAGEGDPAGLGEIVTPLPAEAIAWRSPIHMPRWASRITLEITGVRVERLQEISEIDCEAEIGAEPYSLGNDAYPRFRELWDSLNAKRAPFESNPWVWCLTFKKL